MPKKSAALWLSMALAVVLLSSGCATMTRKSHQRIPVTSAPAGASVSVNGICQGKTPLELRLVRRDKDQVIRIESPGYDPVEIRSRRKLWEGVPLGNLMLGFLPGMVPALMWLGNSHTSMEHAGGDVLRIWFLSAVAIGGIGTLLDIGAEGYALEPKTIVVVLRRTDGPPRIDTLFIEADQLRDIKWIRVHKDR